MKRNRERKIEKGLTEGRISASIWKLALPMMIGGALQNLFTLVDLYFVGMLGHIEVAALSIAGIIMSVLMMFIIGITTGTIALIAHYTGNRKHEKTDEVFGQTILLGIIGSVIMLLITFFGVEPLLKLFGAKGDVLRFGAEFLRIIFGWSIVIFLFVGINQSLRGSGDARTPLKALIIANITNIFFCPLLILGLWFFPRMGVAGSAAATVIGRSVGLIYLILHICIRQSTIQLRWRWLKPNTAIMRRILSIGSYASLQVLVREISFLFLMRLVAHYGDVAIAAYGIGSRLRMVIMVPGFGFANAASVLTGQNLGAGQPDRASRSTWRTVLYYEFLAIPVSILFIAFAPHLIAFFNDYPGVVSIGATYMRYLGATFPFLAFTLVLGQAMNGAGDTRATTIVNAIGQLLVRIPLAYILALALGIGATGIWLGINASDISQGILMIFVFQMGHWKTAHAKHREKLEGKDYIYSNK